MFNSDTGRGEIWFDGNWETTGSRSQVATLNNITTLAQLTALTASDFVVYNNAVDPIILDLDGDGFSFSDIATGASFDINADGNLDRVAWNTSGDGILAMDLDHDGVIDDGSEIFTPDFAGGGFATGADALASLDSNGDGVVDALDEAFSDLLIWQDADADGVSDEGELSSLARSASPASRRRRTRQAARSTGRRSSAKARLPEPTAAPGVMSRLRSRLNLAQRRSLTGRKHSSSTICRWSN